MQQRWTVIVLAGVVGGGCLWEQNVDQRMARLQLGLTSRRVSTSPPPPRPAWVARETSPTEPTSVEVPSSGVIGSMQFTMRVLRHAYVGGELEAGPLERTGSYLGGAYGVAGAEVASARGSLSVEMSGGRRWVRSELGADDVPEMVLEPRVRAQLTLTPQVTVGGVIGASALPDERGWMAGIYLGLYSFEIDRK